MSNFYFKQTVTAMEGVDGNAVYVYAQEMTSRDALEEALGTRYSVEDYNDKWSQKSYSRYSTADCWVTNDTSGQKTIWELKARPDLHIDTYKDGFLRVAKAKSLEKIAEKHPYLQIYVGMLYPLDKSVVVYPLEELQKFPTKKVNAWDPEKQRMVDEENYLVPVSDIDRVHDAGGYVRHWHAFDWDTAYAYNMTVGQELSARGMLQ